MKAIYYIYNIFGGHIISHIGILSHIKNCGVKITPPVLIEDHTMQFTPV